MRRLVPITLLLMCGAVSAPLVHTQTPRPPQTASLVAHEWGTFTSITDADGQAVRATSPYPGQDLPCFVDTLKSGIKYELLGRMRMETPVIYFYAPFRMEVDVDVRFKQGLITEWYPRAQVTPSLIALGTPSFTKDGFTSTLSWKHVTIDPAARTTFTREREASHYYAARETDAAPIEVTGQRDRFLFYRGTTDVAPPLTAAVRPDGSVAVTSATPAPVGDVILFENRGGSIGYQVRDVASNSVVFSASTFDGESAAPLKELEAILIKHGLFPREAKAMIDTWRDTWFEEGERLFYIAPRPFVDDILPLQIAPAPSSVTRVFVGRIELVSARTLTDVRQALETGNDRLLLSYERFLGNIVERLGAASPADATLLSGQYLAYLRRRPAVAKFCE